MSGTSPATPCRSPFATALATHSIPHKYVRWRRLRFPQHRSRWRHLPVHLYAVRSEILSRAGAIEAIATNFKVFVGLPVQPQRAAAIACQDNLTAAYVGTLGRHLSTFVDANYAPYSTVSSALVAPSTSAASIDARRQYDAGIIPVRLAP